MYKLGYNYNEVIFGLRALSRILSFNYIRRVMNIKTGYVWVLILIKI